jgi:hypothetical protein
MPSRREIVQGLSDRRRTTTWWGDAAWNVQLCWFPLVFATVGWDDVAAGAVLALGYVALVALPFEIARHRRWARLGRIDPEIPAGIMLRAGVLAALLVISLGFVASGAAWLVGALMIISLALLAQTAYARQVIRAD